MEENKCIANLSNLSHLCVGIHSCPLPSYFCLLTVTAISYVLSSTAAIGFSTQSPSSLSVGEGNKNLITQATPATSNTKCGLGTPRDKHLQPFACNSIWNVPIGSNAKYVDAYIGSKGAGVDTEWFVVTKKTDQLQNVYMAGGWDKNRCTGTAPQEQAQWHPKAGEQLKVPYDLIIPDARVNFTSIQRLSIFETRRQNFSVV